MKTLAEILNHAIDRLRRGEPIDAILASYPADAEQLRPLLAAAASLHALPPVQLPSQQALRADRSDFLLEVALLQVDPVSAGPFNRLKEWMVHLQSWQFFGPPIQRKEQWKMSTVIVTMTLLVALLVGSMGGVTAMTGDLLPDSPLYGVKLLVEDATLLFTPDPAQRAEQHLAMAEARLREVQQLALAGEVPDAETLARLEQHLALALRYAQELDDDAEQEFLVRSREMVMAQEQQMSALEANADAPVQVALRATRRILTRTSAAIDARYEGSQSEPLREQSGIQATPEAPLAPSLVPPRFRNQGERSPDGTCEDCTPVGDEHKYGQQDAEQPGPGEQGGNPDGTCEDCTPVGDEHKYGQQDAEQPGPGEQGGNPDGTCEDCTPVGDQNQNGPQPEQPGPGEQGGNPDGTCEDCTPVGDQNQNGPQPEQPGPGEQGGNPDSTCEDCTPAGDQNQNGPQPEQPGPGEQGGNPDSTCEDCTPAGDQNQNGPQPEPAVTEQPGADQGTSCGDCVPDGDAIQEQHSASRDQPSPVENNGGGRQP